MNRATSIRHAKDHACPLCGQPAALDGFHVSLDTNEIFIDGKPIRVAPVEAELAELLARSYPRTAAYDYLFAGLWGNTDGPADPLNNVKIHAHRLRTFLKGTGWNVAVYYKRGYRLSLTEMRETPSI